MASKQAENIKKWWEEVKSRNNKLNMTATKLQELSNVRKGQMRLFSQGIGAREPMERISHVLSINLNEYVDVEELEKEREFVHRTKKPKEENHEQQTMDGQTTETLQDIINTMEFLCTELIVHLEKLKETANDK